jgi:hypothetical protein
MKPVLKLIIQKFQWVILIFTYFVTSKSKNKKIIIGVTEIANVLFNMKYLFKEECIVVCRNRNQFYKKNSYDIDISQRKYTKHFFAPFMLGKLAKNAHFFIYLWHEGFLYNRESDFRFLKKHNIPIICVFLGNDIRSRKLFYEYCNSLDFNTWVDYVDNRYMSEDKLKAIARQADKYASIVFSHKFDQFSYLESDQYFFPPPINELLFSFNIEKFYKRPLRVVHAPSYPALKGTPIVRSVIKQLKNEGYDFQYIELTHVSNEVVIQELNRSHIVLNQFYTLITGIFGLEAMATGNAVLMSAKPDNYPYRFNDAWLETEDWQLYGNLKYLLNNPDKILEYARSGYDYTLKNFSRKAVLNHLAAIFGENKIPFPVDNVSNGYVIKSNDC